MHSHREKAEDILKVSHEECLSRTRGARKNEPKMECMTKPRQVDKT